MDTARIADDIVMRDIRTSKPYAELMTYLFFTYLFDAMACQSFVYWHMANSGRKRILEIELDGA